jgi:diguanylate cyclase (GGDEF)-like protein
MPHGPLKVLVVEDDEGTRRACEEAVRSLGHDCRSARDGLEAWEMHQAVRADVILSDWNMPRMDGIELCRRTRAAETCDTYTYFILMSAAGDKEHFLRGMAAGADDYHAKPIDIEELQARLTSASRVIGLNRRLAEKNARLRRDSQTSFRVARVDALTGVFNRLRLNEDLDVLWSRAQRYGQRFSIAMCDLDEFKKLNDRFGHLAGDEVLRRVAEAIRSELRQGDDLYRYGGEEFVVVLPQQTLAEAKRAMDRVRRAVEELAGSLGSHAVTISIGIAEIDLSRDATAARWLERADRVLYRAKARGRNRVEADEARPARAGMGDPVSEYPRADCCGSDR